MQRIVPEILLQRYPANLVEIVLFTKRSVLLAVFRRVLIDGCLRVCVGVIDDVVEEAVSVEVEHRRVRVVEAELRDEQGEAGVPFRDGEVKESLVPFVREGHAVQGRDVEDEKVAGAGGIELQEEGRDLMEGLECRVCGEGSLTCSSKSS